MFPALLLQILIMLIIVGVALWIVSIIPMDPTIRQVIRVVVIVFVAVWLISLLSGGFSAVGPIFRR
jgi:hypothetical protein